MKRTLKPTSGQEHEALVACGEEILFLTAPGAHKDNLALGHAELNECIGNCHHGHDVTTSATTRYDNWPRHDYDDFVVEFVRGNESLPVRRNP